MANISHLLPIVTMILILMSAGNGRCSLYPQMKPFLLIFFVNFSVYGQLPDRTTNFPYVDDSFIMDNYENFEEMVKTPLDRGNGNFS